MSDTKKTNPFMPGAAPNIQNFDGPLPPRDFEQAQELLGPRKGHINLAQMTYHLDTFIVFRPWESCHRCLDAVLGKRIESEDEEEIEGTNIRRRREEPTEHLPDAGDRICPHTMRQNYETLIMRIAKNQLPADPPSSTVLKNGTVMVTMSWWEKDTAVRPRQDRF